MPLVAALDAARALCAAYVVIHHVINARYFPGVPPFPLRLGQEAVLVFFLLSGFVIFANERDRGLRPRGYYLRRLRRIYPPLIVAMIAGTLVALDNGDLAQRFEPVRFWATLLSVQDIGGLKPGVIADPYLDNAPLWSLSYEVFFYLVFPPLLMAWTKRPALTENLVGLACCAAFAMFAAMPGHLLLVGAYFLVWWSGAMAADAYLRGGRSVAAMWRTYRWLLALCLVAAGVVAGTGHAGIGRYPTLCLRHFAFSAGLLAILFGPVGKALLPMSWRFRGTAAFLSSISYGCYVLHYPLLIDWRFAADGRGFVVALALFVALAYLTERQLPRLYRRPAPVRPRGSARSPRPVRVA